MSRNSLFVKAVSDERLKLGLVKTAEGLRLSSPESWTHEITKYMFEKIPYVTKYPTDIVIDVEDQQTGYASGNIIVKNSVSIPIIIKPSGAYSELSPLDVFKYQEKYFPLTKKRIDEIMFSPDMGTLSRTQNIPGAVASDYMEGTTPPGMEEVASANNYRKLGSATALETALEYSTAEQRDRVLNFFDKPEYIAKLASNNTIHILDKIVQYKPMVKSAAQRMSESGVLYTEITKTAGAYRITVHGDDFGAPISEEVSPFTVRQMFGDETFTKVANEGIAFEMKAPRDREVYVLEDMHVETNLIKEAGSYTVYGVGGKKMTGSALTEVNFSNECTGRMLFTNGEKYASAAKMRGNDAPIYTDHLIKSASDISNTFYGSFVFDNEYATAPVKMFGCMAKTASGVEIQACDGRTFVVTDEIVGIIKKGSKVYIPGMAKLVKVGTMTKLMSDEGSIRKLNEAESTGDKMTSVRSFGNKCHLNGVEMSKVAAQSILVNIGALPDEASTIIKRASQGKITVGEKLANDAAKAIKPPTFKSPIKSKIPGFAGSQKVPEFKSTMKLAMIVPEDKSVDAMLSLGFITDENISVFRSFVPQFEEALSNLAGLLVAIRYGFTGMNEEGVANAIRTLDTVTTDLKSIFSTEDMVNSLSA